MRGLNSAEVLWVWERGSRETPARRALTILAPVCTEATRQSLARLTLGERDARLLELRERTFGPRLSSVVRCPACDQEVQADFETKDVRVRHGAIKLSGEWRQGGIVARLRLPDGDDLEAAGRAADAGTARRELIARCILEARAVAGGVVALAALPEEFITAAAARISAADPQANIELALRCPECAHAWSELFDIADFFWTELQAYAHRLLREVHELAAAHGWSEAEVLALTPARRAAYLELVRG
ncbi:MAG: hypothetical protein EPO07_07530 [Verrucomicrobia bacterium]|nr:MAG: hypothetical protein EPO07_07530 [Verrucomicrobiota bacterium]